MPPNLINILTNSTGRDVWHKLHSSRSRLAQFVSGSCSFQSPSELAAQSYTPSEVGTGEPHPGKGVGRVAAARDGIPP